MSEQHWYVTGYPLADLMRAHGEITEWGDGYTVGYFPGEPITAVHVRDMIGDQFAGEVAGDE